MTLDYDIIQVIRSTIANFPIPLDIFHVKAHKDHDTDYDALTPYAQLNVLAGQHAECLHMMNPAQIGTFPTWLPGSATALYHGDTQITTDIPNYIGLQLILLPCVHTSLNDQKQHLVANHNRQRTSWTTLHGNIVMVMSYEA